MEIIQFNGEDYVKASEAARQYKYTADYIGQLCRAKKVDARLVGRTWYVNIRSLAAHKAGRYQKPQTPVLERKKKTSDTASKNKVERTKVFSPAPSSPHSEKTAQTPSRSVSVRYEPDEGSLLPQVSRPTVKLLRVDPAGASRVKVRGHERKPVNLVAEPLPEVSLSGKLKVRQVPDENSDKRDNNQNKALSTNKPKPSKTKDEENNPKEGGQVQLDHGSETVASEPSLVLSEIALEESVTVSGTSSNDPTFLSSYRVVVSAALIGVLFLFFILSAQLVIDVSDQQYSSSLTVQLANIFSLLEI